MPATALQPKPRIVYPRPPLSTDLFREALYEDGQPYEQDNNDDEPEGLQNPVLKQPPTSATSPL